MALVSWTNGWQGTPLGSELVSNLDTVIQAFKEQVSRRFEQGGHAFTADPNSVLHGLPSNNTHDGRHVIDSGGSGIGPDIWKSDMSGRTLIYTDSAITAQAGVDFVGSNVTSGIDPGHQHETTVVVYLPSVAVGRVTGVIFHNEGAGTLTLVSCRTLCWTAPGAATCRIDMHRLDNTYTDPATTGAPDKDTIFSTRPVIASGGFDSDSGTPAVISTAALAEDEAWVFEIDDNDTAADISVVLKVRRG